MKVMQSSQSPPKVSKASTKISNIVQELKAREEAEREEAERQKRKARDTDSELDTSGEVTPHRKMGDIDKVSAAAARKVKADIENLMEKTVTGVMDRMLAMFVTKLDEVETKVKDRIDQVKT